MVFLSPSRTSAGIMAKMRPRKLSLFVPSSALFSDQPVIRRYEAVILTHIGCPKRSSLKNWKGREEGEYPGKDGKRR